MLRPFFRADLARPSTPEVVSAARTLDATADALHQQAFAALTASPGARAFYDHHRARGATHQALRTLSNRLVGILDGCLRHRTRYDESIAWAHRQPAAA